MELLFLGIATVFGVFFALSVLVGGASARAKSLAVKSRLEVVISGLDAIVLLAAARVFTPWATLSPLLWLVPVALVAAGVAGAVLRWSSLPTLRQGRTAARTITFSAVHLAVLATVSAAVLG